MSETPATILPATRPLALWVIVIFTLLLIPLKITSYGYAPGGDARRHVGRAFTDKSFRDIVVMQPQYQVDQSYGWESLLRVVRQATHWNADTLMAFAVVATMLCLFLAPLPWLRWPEAWLAALLAFTVATPDVMGRISEARPLLITEAVLVALLFAWSKSDKTTGTKLFLTILGFAASVFFHGAWYLWVLLLAAFFFAGEWRKGLWLTLCWGLGVALGAVATGHPAEFLRGTLFMAQRVLQEKVPQWMLVGEFNPSGGELPTLILLALVYLWQRQMGRPMNLVRSPVFWVMALAWVGGFQADRWWADWGIPAVLVWLAMQFEEILPSLTPECSWRRILLGALLALPLYLHLTTDLDRRYSHTVDYPVLDASVPALKGWMPDDGGIFYNDRMDFFYNTFYQNPTAPWHYILGFEPALMPDDDLHIYRDIQRHPGNFQYYEPWIAKMKPADRMVIYSGYEPPLPQLEWYNPVSDIWLGRAERTDPLDTVLTNLPSIQDSKYKVDPYISAAAQLQQLGPRDAIKHLFRLARSPSDANEQQTAILCRMLFSARPGSAFDRPAFLGGPSFIGVPGPYPDPYSVTKNYINWPREPIEIVDGVPFAVVTGYTYEGIWNPQGAALYVGYCVTNCDWSSFRFSAEAAADKQQALRKLVASTKWRGPLDEGYLVEQIQ